MTTITNAAPAHHRPSRHLASDPSVRRPEQKAVVSNCPACEYHAAVPFLNEEHQPLASMDPPQNRDMAVSMKRFPLSFARCISCGHVYNTKFDSAELPQGLMAPKAHNLGLASERHVQNVCDLLLNYLPPAPTVIDMGCGDGSLLRLLAQQRPAGRYLGFAPVRERVTAPQIQFCDEPFVPEIHVSQFSPHLMIGRDFLEHLSNPLGFLRAISVACNLSGAKTRLYCEVPCIDRAMETARMVDFHYQHSSHFTTTSFTEMLKRSDGATEMLLHHFNREIVTGLLQFGGSNQPIDLAIGAEKHRLDAAHAKNVVMKQLAAVSNSGAKTAIWGGTGRAAAFMNYFQVDAGRFPLVVDSDTNKVGGYVPGMGQEIKSRDVLLSEPPEIVIIPAQARARDIIHEMSRAGISCACVLIEHQGQLIDFHEDKHPY